MLVAVSLPLIAFGIACQRSGSSSSGRSGGGDAGKVAIQAMIDRQPDKVLAYVRPDGRTNTICDSATCHQDEMNAVSGCKISDVLVPNDLNRDAVSVVFVANTCQKISGVVSSHHLDPTESLRYEYGTNERADVSTGRVRRFKC